MQETLIIAFLLNAMALSTQRNHFMYALLCIEEMMLALFMLMMMNTNSTINMTNMPAPIFLLTMAACEASVGLSLMIATIRTHGNDLLNNLNML